MSLIWNHFKSSFIDYINQYDDLFNENMFINKKNSYINLLKENQEFIESINKILKTKNKKIQKKKVIPIKYEEQFEHFCHNKHVLALKNIDDMKYEKNLTYHIDDPYLFIIEHSFSDKECDDMIKQFENESYFHRSGHTGGGYLPIAKKTIEINITRTETWSKWNKLCFNKLNKGLEKYAVHCWEKCHNDYLLNTPIHDTGYQLQKYIKEQQYYTWHHDSWLDHKNSEHRVVTYLWYLNDLDEGGETYFFHGKIKPKKGTLLLFPAFWTYNHKGEIPISNDKYIITGWVYSKF